MREGEVKGKEGEQENSWNKDRWGVMEEVVHSKHVGF